MNTAIDTLPVTVVIPAFNRAVLLRETLTSVAAQTVRPAEVIVVDDGSTDDTAAVAASFGVTVVRTPNNGVSTARNLGIDRARTPWIALVDSDDLWEPAKLETQWGALRRAPRAGLSFTDTVWFGNRGTNVPSGLAASPEYRRTPKRSLGDRIYAFNDRDLLESLCTVNFCMISGVMVRRDVAQATGFNPIMRFAEDHDFMIRALGRTSAIAVEVPLTRYRHHHESASRNEIALFLGSISIAEAAQRRPERYPSGVPEALLRNVWQLHRRVGIAYLRVGNLVSARHHLRTSLIRRPDPTTAVALLAANVAPDRATRAVAVRPR